MSATIRNAGKGNGHGHWIVRLGNQVLYREVTKQEARRLQGMINQHIAAFKEQVGLAQLLSEAALSIERLQQGINA